MQQKSGLSGEKINMPLKEIKGLFPNLNATRDTITSEINPNYNCIAWTLGETQTWWEPWGGLILPSAFPPYQWPDNLPHDRTVDTYIDFYRAHGFEVCDSEQRENGYQKIVLYENNGEVQHAARQLPDGLWTSKLGEQEDIQHRLRDIEGSGEYRFGTASVFLKRKIGS
jgi:hypothetical protein